MKEAMRLCLGAAWLSLAVSVAAEPPSSTPVGDIGAGSPCESIGEVRGLKAGGEGFLAVRAGPGSEHALVDKLGNGRRVYLCRGEGRWVSVLYPDKGAKDMRCVAESADVRGYRGPCKSGWVHWTWVEIIAG
ncbi:MAG: hypothetical protein JF591_09180 [Lysobacter sp.]|nr:hypothetical protein [Lysobacter sp.]